MKTSNQILMLTAASLASFAASAGDLKWHFQDYPSPLGSVGQQSVGVFESVGGAGAFVVGTRAANRNSYSRFTSAYRDYQQAAADYEKAGGKAVTPPPGEKGVAVLVPAGEDRAARRRRAAEGGRTATKAEAKPGEGGEAAAAAKTTEETAAAERGAGTRIGETIEQTTDRVRGAAHRLTEAIEDSARQSEVASRALNISASTDPLGKAAERLTQSRMRLVAAAEEVLAQEGTRLKQAFVPLQKVQGEDVVIPAETLDEAASLGRKIRGTSIATRLGGVLLLADGIYRIYLIRDMRSPGFFPLSWGVYEGARKILVRR